MKEFLELIHFLFIKVIHNMITYQKEKSLKSSRKNFTWDRKIFKERITTQILKEKMEIKKLLIGVDGKISA